MEINKENHKNYCNGKNNFIYNVYTKIIDTLIIYNVQSFLYLKHQ